MIRNLAYIGFVSPRSDEWRTFGPEVLGLQLADDGPDGAVRLRLDDAAWRIAVHPGDTDDLAYLGWEVAGAAGLDHVVARVEEAGVEVHPGGAADAAWFRDPFGFRHELVHGLRTGEAFRPGRPLSGFVTGEQGLGHAVLVVPDLVEAERFFTEVLGFRVSDTIAEGVTVRFLHCPGRAARHHSLALADVPGMVGVHHVMLEVGTIDDVGGALDLVVERGLPLAMTLGRHPNDGMTSFYVRTPSGFEIEYGTGGIVVDDETWTTGSYDAMSTWGHKPPAEGALFPGILRRGRTARRVRVGDHAFFVNETGRRGAPPVVWLHGSGPGVTALSNWEGMIDALAGEFHNVAPDMLGYGDSSHPDPPPQGLRPFTDLRVETLLGLLDALGLEKVDLVGNSMGGIVALSMAQRAPERVGRLVLMGCGGAPIEGVLTPGLLKLVTFYDNPTTEAMAELLAYFVHDTAAFGDELRGIAEARLPKAVRPEVERSHRATFSAGGEPLPFAKEDLASVVQPTLVVHGDDDRIVPLEASRYFAEHLPNARLEVFEDTGHWLQIEQGGRFAALVRSFLQEATA